MAEPTAWHVYTQHWETVTLLKEIAEAAFEDVKIGGGKIEPLFPAPQLTDEERHALVAGADALFSAALQRAEEDSTLLGQAICETWCERAATIRALLKRLGALDVPHE